MFKKMLSIVMVVTLFTVQAHATTQNGLKAAFDEMNYNLTVEWDQKDKTVYEKELKKFTATVRDLQKKGLTNTQLIEFAKSEIKDAKVARDLETAFSMVTINKMSTEDASKYMMDSMKRAYSVGASWNGDVLVYLTVGILIVAIAVAVAAGGVTVVDNGYVGGGCYDSGCYYYDYCDYDYWGYYSCYTDYVCDTYCY